MIIFEKNLFKRNYNILHMRYIGNLFYCNNFHNTFYIYCKRVLDNVSHFLNFDKENNFLILTLAIVVTIIYFIPRVVS